jgi:hypothetical protein
VISVQRRAIRHYNLVDLFFCRENRRFKSSRV